MIRLALVSLLAAPAFGSQPTVVRQPKKLVVTKIAEGRFTSEATVFVPVQRLEKRVIQKDGENRTVEVQVISYRAQRQARISRLADFSFSTLKGKPVSDADLAKLLKKKKKLPVLQLFGSVGITEFDRQFYRADVLIMKAR